MPGDRRKRGSGHPLAPSPPSPASRLHVLVSRAPRRLPGLGFQVPAPTDTSQTLISGVEANIGTVIGLIRHFFRHSKSAVELVAVATRTPTVALQNQGGMAVASGDAEAGPRSCRGSKRALRGREDGAERRPASVVDNNSQHSAGEAGEAHEAGCHFGSGCHPITSSILLEAAWSHWHTVRRRIWVVLLRSYSHKPGTRGGGEVPMYEASMGQCSSGAEIGGREMPSSNLQGPSRSAEEGEQGSPCNRGTRGGARETPVPVRLPSSYRAVTQCGSGPAQYYVL